MLDEMVQGDSALDDVLFDHEAGRCALGVAGAKDSATTSPGLGLRGHVACQAAGISHRQLDYWDRTGLVGPSIRSAAGPGSQRLYSFRDVLLLKVVKRLVDAGVSLQQVRVAIGHLRAQGVQDLTAVTLMSDGAGVYECTTDDEVVDLLRGGQAMFAIAVGGVWREMAGTLGALPVERLKDSSSRVENDEHISRPRPLLRAI